MKNNIRYSIVTKVAGLIAIFIFLFTLFVYNYINILIQKELEDINIKQKIFIENQIKKFEAKTSERELEFIKFYTNSLIGAISEALYNLDYEVIKNILYKYIRLKSIKKIDIYDLIANKPFLEVLKNEKGDIRFLFNVNDNSNKFEFFRYYLNIEGKKIGYVKIYYDTTYLKKEAKKDTADEFKKITLNFEERLKTLKKQQNFIFSIVLIYILFIIVIIITILNIYIKKPIQIVQNNFDSFFNFLKNPNFNYRLIPYNSKDEFGVIASNLNQSINNAAILHNKLSQFIKIINKHVFYIDYDQNGKILQVSDAMCKKIGYKREEILYKNIRNFLFSRRDKKFYSYIKNMKILNEQNINIRYKTKENSVCHFASTVTPKYDKSGKIYRITEILVDKTYEKELIKLHKEIEHTQREIIFTIGTISEERSRETGDHIKRVAGYTNILARHCNLEKEEINLITIASAMHDVGKIAIADSILNKPGKLTQEEFEIMKTHTLIGYKMLKHSHRKLLKAAAIIALNHHEKYDGSGYPNALKGKQIHIYGRIVALADVFDALSSDRVYKKAWEDDRIFAYIKEQKGKHFDPVLVDIFFEHLECFLKVREKYKDKNKR